jgi:heterodisulfide reductase subunit B
MLEKTRKILKETTGREFTIPKNIAHPSDIIYKFRLELKDRMKYQLINRSTGKPLKGVEHVGCHYAKMFPEKGIGKAEFPQVLAGMIEAWGGEVVDYPERRHCCGFGFRNYLVMANRGFSIANTKKKFESMEPFEPDFIVCNCPGCPMFLDRWQYTIAEMEGKTYGNAGRGIPVLTYEEMLGILLGHNPWNIGLQIHQVSVESLLDKIGVEYDPNKKYLGISGKDLGVPEKPGVLKV